ncbi:hypothetical protein A2U01_0078799 [Trifolium medium]|uniref:Uncharacterized protein n=1 Tax=Trifolium medium TaxID=97028 RepID=A0A392T944_9FABA|nr:hypothetical protein [Trifolium medium]
MAGDNSNHETPMTLQAAVNEIRRLQAEVINIKQGKADKQAEPEEDEIADSQPLAQAL